MIPDFSARSVCNVKGINILTGAVKRSTSGVGVHKLSLLARTELIVQLQVIAGSPNHRSRGKAGSPKGSGNRAVSHTHHCETAENLL